MSGGVASEGGYRPPDVMAGPARRHWPVHHYTRYVAIMRRLLPAVAIVLVAIVVSWPQLIPDDRVQVGYSKKDFADLGRHALSVANPRYYGLDGEQQPYTVLADTARQTPDQVVLLDRPRADMQMKDGSGILLDARHGTYRQKEQVLHLNGNVNLFQDTGYEIHTNSAVVDLPSGTAEGHEPVDGHGPTIQLEGEGFRLLERGRTIFLKGKSHLVLYPERQPQ